MPYINLITTKLTLHHFFSSHTNDYRSRRMAGRKCCSGQRHTRQLHVNENEYDLLGASGKQSGKRSGHEHADIAVYQLINDSSD